MAPPTIDIEPGYSDMTVRRATNADRDGVRAVVHSVLQEYGLKPAPDTTDADIEDIEAFYDARGGFFEVIVDSSGEVIGTAALAPHSDGVAELRKMYFLPRLRGKGLGRAMLRRLIEEAVAMGFKRMYLETASSMHEAISLYESVGFKPTSDLYTPRCDRAYYLELPPQKK